MDACLIVHVWVLAPLAGLEAQHGKAPPRRRLSPLGTPTEAAGNLVHDGFDGRGGSQLPESPWIYSNCIYLCRRMKRGKVELRTAWIFRVLLTRLFTARQHESKLYRPCSARAAHDG